MRFGFFSGSRKIKPEDNQIIETNHFNKGGIAMEVLTAIIDVIIAFTAGWIYLPY
ncbi:MAG: hypothetical protein MUE70_11640 [Desulfobacterales bacterium]|nr:hypothetical protein [Desulfobacterales bacterium]